MNLRNRTLLILGLTFVVFVVSIAAVSLSVTLSGLERMEYQDMDGSINQTKAALNEESAGLMRTAQDWGWWDDIYHFVAGQNPGFVDSNVDPLALATLNLNLFMILDDSGNLIYNQALSSDFGTSGPVPEDLTALIRSNPQIVYRPYGDTGLSGILDTPDGPMIIASVPILRSDRTGPVIGTLVMGRYLGSGPIERIAKMTGYMLTLEKSRTDAAGTNLPGEQKILLVSDNDKTITGYSTLRDLSGTDLVMGVSMDRQLYRIGIANISTYLVLIVLWAIMTGIIVVIVMDRTILQRMGMLTDRVRSFSNNNKVDISTPVLSGDDELAELEKTILSSQKDLQLREKQLRVFVNAMPGPAALFSREGTILLANPAFGEYVNKRPEEIIGSDYQSCVPPQELEKYTRFGMEAIRKKEIVHFEDETGGKTLLISYYPVLDQDGEVIQLGLLTFDISERKRLENALQKITKKISLLNTVIFSDIQNKVFVQMGYLELARQTTQDPQLRTYLEKEDVVVREIQSSLRFAKQYNDMGASQPRWQNVLDVMLFAISHLELGSIIRDFHVDGLEIYADSLLERVFVTLIENTIMHAKGATVIRAGYTILGDDAVIFIEDNGQGIAPDTKEEIFKRGLGSGGSASLFLSREILSITGIKIRENGVFGKGARFEIRVPKGSYRISSK